MKKVLLDFADLGMALDDHDRVFASFLDTETGEVVWYSEYDPEDEEEEAELRERIEADKEGRYLGLEPIPSHDGFRFMEDFVDTLPDGPARDALFDALDRPRPFRRFKDALHGFPEVRERWYAYEAERQKEWFRDYLLSYAVELEWREAPPPSTEGGGRP
jgi:hypothetical protein